MHSVELQDAVDAPEGATLYKYTACLSRRVKEEGKIIIVTATPPERLKDRWDEVWDQVSDRELLLATWDEDNHRETILSQETTAKRCPYTAEMDFNKGLRHVEDDERNQE